MSGIHAALQHVGRIGNRRIFNPHYILRFLITFSFIFRRFRFLGGTPSSVPILKALSGLTTTKKITDHNCNHEQKQ